MLVRPRGYEDEEVVRWQSVGKTRMVGLQSRKEFLSWVVNDGKSETTGSGDTSVYHQRETSETTITKERRERKVLR